MLQVSKMRQALKSAMRSVGTTLRPARWAGDELLSALTYAAGEFNADWHELAEYPAERSQVEWLYFGNHEATMLRMLDAALVHGFKYWYNCRRQPLQFGREAGYPAYFSPPPVQFECGSAQLEVTVTGAGSAEINGRYVELLQQHNHARRFRKRDSSGKLFGLFRGAGERLGAARWHVAQESGKGASLYMYSSLARASETLPPTDCWEIDGRGVSPPPTVEVHCARA